MFCQILVLSAGVRMLTCGLGRGTSCPPRTVYVGAVCKPAILLLSVLMNSGLFLTPMSPVADSCCCTSLYPHLSGIQNNDFLAVACMLPKANMGPMGLTWSLNRPNILQYGYICPGPKPK
jgi:hypothetical protein